MITEDYVSFETAKLLKEKGFNELFYFFYRTDDKMIHHAVKANPLIYDNNIDDEVISAPTLQMAMKWLREVYDLQIIFIPVRTKQHKNWTFEIYKEFIPLYIDVSCFSTYEEACEAAIKYCLENLI